MKDAYSFDADDASLDESYNKMFNAYKKIFDRCKIDYKIVKADTGAMGGKLSEEFQAVTDIGEDVLVLCDGCDYSSNLEVSSFKIEESNEEKKTLELVETPHMETIEDVANYLNIDKKKTVKALLMNVKDELVVFFIRGDREFNESKACKLFGVNEIGFANDELIATSNAVPGFTGPVGLNAKIVIDKELLSMKNFCCGGNKEGYHYINANIDDIKYDMCEEIACVTEGDTCPVCGNKLYFKKGIEIGNTFKLGTKYAEKLGLTYSDENNEEKLVTMGCYGIGVGRVLAAVVEQHNDEKGMILPMSIAPFKVCIIVTNTKDEEMMNYANKLHDDLNKLGIDTLLDDRDERPGVKFNDMDLIGIPLRITVGKKYAEGNVELKLRHESEVLDVKLENVIEEVNKIIEREM